MIMSGKEGDGFQLVTPEDILQSRFVPVSPLPISFDAFWKPHCVSGDGTSDKGDNYIADLERRFGNGSLKNFAFVDVQQGFAEPKELPFCGSLPIPPALLAADIYMSPLGMERLLETLQEARWLHGVPIPEEWLSNAPSAEVDAGGTVAQHKTEKGKEI